MIILLNRAEQKIFNGCEAGEWVIFLSSTRPSVRAVVLRHILLGLEISINGTIRRCQLKSPGLRVKGAFIDGDLKLEDCRNLPVLALENCEFSGNILLYDSRLAHFSLKKSLIRGVKMKGAEIASSFDFSDTQPVNEFEPAWINAHGCTIRGGVRGDGAHLRAQPSRNASIPLGKEHYALRLSDSKIDGSVRLRTVTQSSFDTDSTAPARTRGFNAEGGINISATHIRGDLICEGASTTAGERYSFTTQASKIEGVVLMDNLVSSGVLWMAGVRIGGTLALNGAQLSNSNKETNRNNDALVLSSAEINGDLQMSKQFHAVGRVILNSIKIHGSLACDGARLSNFLENGEGYALVARHAEISGSVFLCKLKATGQNFIAEGTVSLVGAKILGSIDCEGSYFLNHSHTDSKVAFTLSSATIGHNIYFSNMRSVGMVSLRGCQVGRNLDCQDSVFIATKSSVEHRNEKNALDATGLSILGNVSFERTSVIGSLNFEHSQIAGSFRWDALHFPKQVEIEQIDQNIIFRKTLFDYNGFLQLDVPQRSTPIGLFVNLKLSHMRVGSTLQAYSLTAEVPLLIDLSAVHVHTLDDVKINEINGHHNSWPSGWGGDWITGPKLDLDGFNYQRIKHFPKRVKPMKEDAILKLWRLLWNRGADIVSPRLDWLGQQCSQPADATNKDHFLPYPYLQLATVMRNQGHLAAARKVQIAAEKREGDLGWIQMVFQRYFFGWGFGYGWSARNATVSVLACLFLGFVMVKVAYDKGDMVLTPELITAYSYEFSYDSTTSMPTSTLRVEQRMTAPVELKSPQAKGSTVSFDQVIPTLPPAEWICDNREIQPIFYALDMMLPVIPLHQEDRCELAVPPRPLSWLMFGHVIWALFSIAGKIVTSLALITYSGVLKPQDE